MLLGGSLGVAKSASAAAAAHPAAAVVERVVGASHERVVHAAVPPIRHHFAELEVDSGEVRTAIETASLANARRIGEVRPGRLMAARAGCDRHETPGT